MSDILDTIDALLTDTPVLTQDELFKAAFDRVVGVDGSEFDCDCQYLDAVMQIGWTRNSRRPFIGWGQQETDIFFETNPLQLTFGNSECGEYTYYDDSRTVCWYCEEIEPYNNEALGLCPICIGILKGEGDGRAAQYHATLLGVSEGERRAFSMELRDTGN